MSDPENNAATEWVPTDYDKRQTAVHAAVNAGAKPAEVVKIATDIYAFLTAGNASASTPKPATETAKPAKASAPATEAPATEQSSDKPAASTTDASKATSPSDASGFAEDGTEIDAATIRAAAVKFVSANGEPALVAKLAEHGADRLSALEPAKYASFIASLEVPVADAGVFD